MELSRWVLGNLGQLSQSLDENSPCARIRSLGVTEIHHLAPPSENARFLSISHRREETRDISPVQSGQVLRDTLTAECQSWNQGSSQAPEVGRGAP